MRRALLLPAALAALAVAAPPPEAPWIVVQKDGGRVVFAGRPAVRSGKLVGSLAGTGTLVSVPVARVDEDATRKANEPGSPAAASAAPKAVPTPRPFETPPLGDRVRLRASGEEASRILESSRKGDPATAPSPAAGAEEAEAEPRRVAEPTDRQGRDESWWRERAAVVRGDYESAGQVLAEAEARLEAAERAYLGGSQAERNTFVLRVNEERAAAEAARAEYRRASSAWEALQEDARKSGAFPGWLR